jgi:pimeloyl-ACP methyl ester carboxylesterase
MHVSGLVGRGQQAIEELKRQHRVILLVGYSLGGALALNAALEQRPDGLVLLAPFWSFGDKWFSLLWPVIKFCFPRLKPLKRADFAASEVRRGLERMFKDIDLDDRQIQQALREAHCIVKTDRANPPTRTARVYRSGKDRRANPDHSREPGQGRSTDSHAASHKRFYQSGGIS